VDLLRPHAVVEHQISDAQGNQLAVVEAGLVPRFVALIGSALSDDQVSPA
jgi:hypothetical protein